MDLTSLGTGYVQELAANALTSAKNTGLTDKDLSNASDDELMDACKQFEEYFVEQIFKTALKSTTSLSGDNDTSAYMGTMKDYFQDQYSKEIATEASKSGQLGLAKELYEQMKRSQGVTIEEALNKKLGEAAGATKSADTESTVDAESTSDTENSVA